jgi:membrane-bound ClpP family serine protease
MKRQQNLIGQLGKVVDKYANKAYAVIELGRMRLMVKCKPNTLPIQKGDMVRVVGQEFGYPVVEPEPPFVMDYALAG